MTENSHLREVKNTSINDTFSLVDASNNIPICTICMEKIAYNINYNKFNIACCQLGSVLHYYHLECLTRWVLSKNTYKVSCPVCKGILKDYWAVHVFNLMFMCYKSDKNAIEAIGNIMQELAKRRLLLHKYVENSNNLDILSSNIDIFYKLEVILKESDIAFNVLYICDKLFFERLSYLQFGRIINNESHRFMVPGNFVDYLTFDYLMTLEEFMLKK